MRIAGIKPVSPRSGYPWIGVVKLTTDSTIRVLKTGITQWNCIGSFEYAGKEASIEERSKCNIRITTGFDEALARSLTAFPKGTSLFIAGALKYDEYWTKKNGKKEYTLFAEFVLAQPDYSEFAKEKNENNATMDGGNTSGEYDPGF